MKLHIHTMVRLSFVIVLFVGATGLLKTMAIPCVQSATMIMIGRWMVDILEYQVSMHDDGLIRTAMFHEWLPVIKWLAMYPGAEFSVYAILGKTVDHAYVVDSLESYRRSYCEENKSSTHC